MKRTGWMLVILVALVVPAGSVAGEPAAAPAAGSKTSEDELAIDRASKADDPDEAARLYGALLLGGTKDALAIGREDLALNIIEKTIGTVWAQAESMTIKKLAADRKLRIAAMEKISREQNEIEKKLEELAKMNEALKAENETLRAANDALRVRLGEGVHDSAPAATPGVATEPPPTAAPAKPPMRIEELLAAAREYVDAPAGETQAAREAKQERITNRLVGRDFVLTAPLKNVTRQEKDGTFTVMLQWKSQKLAVKGYSTPAETIYVQTTVSDASTSLWTIGTPVMIRARLTKVLRCDKVSEFSGLVMFLQAEEAKLSR